MTPSGLARKLDVSHKVIDECLTEYNIPVQTVTTDANKTQRRIPADQVLSVVDAITATKPGLWPDLEKRKVGAKGTIVIDVDPSLRPQHETVLRRGRIYTRRRFAFRQ